MCGIAGFVGQGNETTLKQMTQILSYRGPDEKGYFFDRENNVGLGHQRLSIIDLKTGSQPIFNEDKSIAVIFNGEIYNFLELKKELKTHRFYTQTDTEVLIHLYEEKGDEFIRKLEGMFAFALWDSKNKKLILARDRFGEKPLYFCQKGRTLIFGSELKALLAHPNIQKELNSDSLAKYFLYEFIPAPQTIFKNIYKLPAAHFLVFSQDKKEIKEYWNIVEEREKLKDGMVNLNEKQILEITDQKLEAGVKKMLIADVPLGIFLSGGIDSSTVAYYAQKNSSQKIKTFSIGFNEQSFDESTKSQKVARLLGTEHFLKIFNTKELLTIIPEIYQKLDEPMADPSLLPTFLLSRFAREKIKVALGGDGSDELFMGYQTFQAQRIAQLYKLVPYFLRNYLVKPIISKLPTSFKYMSFDFKVKKFTQYFDYPFLIRNQLWTGAFNHQEVSKLLNWSPKNLFEDIKIYQGRLANLDNFHRLSYLYLKHYLQDGILTKVDRASMFNSLEVRAPFLDAELASWIFSLPLNKKLKRLKTKYLLKKLMADRLDREIVNQKKQGFQPPIAKWLTSELHQLTDHYLTKETTAKQGLFNVQYIEKIIKEHQGHKVDHRKKIWTLLVFQLWWEQFGSIKQTI